MNIHQKLQAFLIFLQAVAICNEVGAKKICTFYGNDCSFPFDYDDANFTDECVTSTLYGKWCYTTEDLSEWAFCIPCPRANSTKTEKTTLATPLAIGSEDEHTEDSTIDSDQSSTEQIDSTEEDMTTETATSESPTKQSDAKTTTTLKRMRKKKLKSAKPPTTVQPIQTPIEATTMKSTTVRPVIERKKAKVEPISKTTATTMTHETISATKKAKEEPVQPEIVVPSSTGKKETKSHSEETTTHTEKAEFTKEATCTLANVSCDYPFTYKGVTYNDTCVPSFFKIWGWCYTNSSQRQFSDCTPCFLRTATAPIKVTVAPPKAKALIITVPTTVNVQDKNTTTNGRGVIEKDSAGLSTITIVILALSILFVIIMVVMVYLYVMKLRRSRNADLTPDENGTKEPMLNKNGNGNAKQNGKSNSREDNELQPLNSKETGQGDYEKEKKNCVQV